MDLLPIVNLNVMNTWFNDIITEEGLRWIISLVRIVVIWVLSRILIKVGSVIISGFFNRQAKSRYGMDEKKANTLKMLILSIFRYLIYFILAVNIIAELGLAMTAQSIIATAGIGGLAIGFGAQNLVKDVITGFFLLLEDQYAVGDFVTIGDTTGTVEDIELRITKIRAFKGDLTTIPNGQVMKVTNFSRGNSLAIVDISIAYEVNIDQALKVMEEAAAAYSKDNPDIVEPPQAVGVTGFGDSDVNIRLIARTQPMKHFAVERELRKRVKEAFDSNGIEIPYPRRVVITQRAGEDEA